MILKVLIRSRKTGESSTEVHTVPDDYCVIGRENATIQVRDTGCSRQHAALIQTADGTLHLKDLASKNGTYVKGEKIRSKPIKPGDEFVVGDTIFTLVQHFSEGALSEREVAVIDSIVHHWPDMLSCLPKKKQEEVKLIGGLK